MQTEQRVPLKFINRYGVYQPGETAGFDKATADQIINQGYAKPIDEDGNIILDDTTEGGEIDETLTSAAADDTTEGSEGDDTTDGEAGEDDDTTEGAEEKDAANGTGKGAEEETETIKAPGKPPINKMVENAPNKSKGNKGKGK